MHCFKFKASAPQPSIIGSASLRCPSKPGARPGSKGTAIVAVETAVQVHQGSSREGISQGRHEPKPAMSGVPQVVPTYIAENAIRVRELLLDAQAVHGFRHFGAVGCPAICACWQFFTSLALPPSLAAPHAKAALVPQRCTVMQLYRDCLRLADYLGSQVLGPDSLFPMASLLYMCASLSTVVDSWKSLPGEAPGLGLGSHGSSL